MNSVFQKLQMCVTPVSKQALASCRVTQSIQHPVWASVAERQYRSKPTQGIGRWQHLLQKEPPKKKKDRHQMKPILAASDTSYGTLSFIVSGYDMTVVEHYSQYIHNLCNRLGLKVVDCYGLPTKSTEVMLMPEQGTKMYVDAILKTYQRVVQLSNLNAVLCPIFMDVLMKNQPEGVNLSVKEHTEGDFHARFKTRPELEGLIAQMNQ